MDGLKELVDAFSSRVRSPVFGSIVIAFLLWNWQGIFLLLFGAGAAADRLVAFTENLGMWDYGVPVVLGLAYLVIGPWLNLVAAIAVARPVNTRRDLVDKWAVERAQKKAALATELAEAATEAAAAELETLKAETEVSAERQRAELAERETELKRQEAEARIAEQKREEQAALREIEVDKREQEAVERARVAEEAAEAAAAEARRREQEILDRAKADLEASKIENEELRAKVEGQLEEERDVKARLLSGFAELEKGLSRSERKILTTIMQGNGQTLKEKAVEKDRVVFASGSVGVSMDALEYDTSVGELVKRKILHSSGPIENQLELTSLGIEMMNRLGDQE